MMNWWRRGFCKQYSLLAKMKGPPGTRSLFLQLGQWAKLEAILNLYDYIVVAVRQFKDKFGHLFFVSLY